MDSIILKGSGIYYREKPLFSISPAEIKEFAREENCTPLRAISRYFGMQSLGYLMAQFYLTEIAYKNGDITTIKKMSHRTGIASFIHDFQRALLIQHHLQQEDRSQLHELLKWTPINSARYTLLAQLLDPPYRESRKLLMIQDHIDLSRQRIIKIISTLDVCTTTTILNYEMTTFITSSAMVHDAYPSPPSYETAVAQTTSTPPPPADAPPPYVD